MKPKFTVQLTQHTPLIHFQHDQTGATLRATEVKAKLDKFLLTKIKKKWKDVDKAWKTNPNTKDHKAWNYKLFIELLGEPNIEDPSPQNHKGIKKNIALGYFGNMGKTPDKYLISHPNITLVFFCFSPSLKKMIKENISDFFLTHNFGTRQNRGYGSFTVKEEQDKPSNVKEEQNKPSKAQFSFQVYKDDIKEDDNRSLALITMEAIDWFYRSLRQGINHGTFSKGFIPWLYMKPMLFQFAAKKGNDIQWEKKTIKEWFFKGRLAGQKKKHKKDKDAHSALEYFSKEKRLVKDLFGLSTEQTWMNYPSKENRPPSITKEDPRGSKDEKKIERYPSPLRFKPLIHPGDGFMTVYFWAEKLDDEYLSASFEIKKNNKPNNDPKNPRILEMWKDFDMNAFFEFAFAENRLENSIRLIASEGEPIEDLLINIYQSIRQNTYKK